MFFVQASINFGRLSVDFMHGKFVENNRYIATCVVQRDSHNLQIRFFVVEWKWISHKHGKKEFRWEEKVAHGASGLTQRQHKIESIDNFSSFILSLRKYYKWIMKIFSDIEYNCWREICWCETLEIMKYENIVVDDVRSFLVPNVLNLKNLEWFMSRCAIEWIVNFRVLSNISHLSTQYERGESFFQ